VKVATDPTNTFQNQVRNTVKQSKTTERQQVEIHKYEPLSPLHQRTYKEQPIRPVVNWRNAHAYQLSKLFTKKINHLSPLPNAFNVKNTHDLIRNLNDTPLLPHYTLASIDITNLYSNIPVTETKTILTNMLKHELVDLQTQQKILRWYDVITKQNYLSHNKKIII